MEKHSIVTGTILTVIYLTVTLQYRKRSFTCFPSCESIAVALKLSTGQDLHLGSSSEVALVHCSSSTLYPAMTLLC